MTITYSLDISSSTFFGIHRLLFRWRGSLWKSIYPELLCWLLIYYVLYFSYTYAMTRDQQKIFEQVCYSFKQYEKDIPITFMLGFYVNAVFGRWNQIFENLGWIDSPALLIATYVRGTDEEARRIRRNIVRYMILVQAMVFRDISSCVQKRFPTMDHLVTAGFMTSEELKEFDSIPSANIKYWTPIQWAFLLLRRAKDKNMIESDIIYVDLLEKIRQFRVNVLTLTLYDWVTIPLVYTQVVNLAVRSYFFIALMSRQYVKTLNKENDEENLIINFYVPFISILQFLFYVGWIKVAEVLLNPLGEDDDDFETNWIIDRNLQVGLSIVDDCYDRIPNLERDVFWESTVPEPLYTLESAIRPHNPMVGSCNDVSSQEDALLLRFRRKRLMSTATGYDNLYYKNGEELAYDEIVPVENHNPSRRTSVCGTSAFSESSFGTGTQLLDSVRRKFTSLGISRRDSLNSTTLNVSDFDKTISGRVLNSSTPRGSIHSINSASLQNQQQQSDNSTTNQFSQSLNIGRTINRQVETPFRHSFNDVKQVDNIVDENQTIEKGSSDQNNKTSFASNIWTITEMLPVIEEVQERLRRNTKDTESVHSTDFACSSKAPTRADSVEDNESDYTQVLPVNVQSDFEKEDTLIESSSTKIVKSDLEKTKMKTIENENKSND